MIRPRALLALSLLAGCGGAPTPPPPVEPAIVVVPTSNAPTPPAEVSAAPRVEAPPPPPAEPPTFALPSPAACELDTAHWSGHPTSVSELRFREGGPVFARINNGKARLFLPIGVSAQGAGLHSANDGLTLRGHVSGAAIALYGAQAVIFEGFAVPTSRKKLTWERTTIGNITVTLDKISGVTPAQTPLSATVSCGAVTLDWGSFSPEPSALGAKRTRRGVLRTDAPVPLSITPTGAPTAELRARSEMDGELLVAEVSGPRTRIFWPRFEALIFGWVPTGDLRPPPSGGVGHGSGHGIGAGFGRSVHPIDRLVCGEDVPVMAEAGGERMIVGSIAARTIIDRMARHGDDVEVWVRTDVVQIPPGARLLARAALLEGCAPAPL